MMFCFLQFLLCGFCLLRNIPKDSFPKRETRENILIREPNRKIVYQNKCTHHRSCVTFVLTEVIVDIKNIDYTYLDCKRSSFMLLNNRVLYIWAKE